MDGHHGDKDPTAGRFSPVHEDYQLQELQCSRVGCLESKRSDERVVRASGSILPLGSNWLAGELSMTDVAAGA